jgi:hypothetical protein
MQSDGNLVIYNTGGEAKWNSNTAGFPGAYLALQNEGNLVIYQDGIALWDWASGRLGQGGGGPTAAETTAVNWARARLGSTAWGELCLSFVVDAWGDAGVELRSHTSGVAWNDDTDPQDVWGHTVGGMTGSGAPPFGALVFFDAKSGYNPEEFSHVTIMGSGGEMISTPDAFNGSTVHEEKMAQFEHSGAYSTYVGWWLPDG